MSTFLGLDEHQWGGFLVMVLPVAFVRLDCGAVVAVFCFGLAHLGNRVFREFG